MLERGSIPALQTTGPTTISSAIEETTATIITAGPKIVTGVLFLAIAALLVKLVLWVVKKALQRSLPGASPVYRQFVLTIIAVFLWFGVVLSFLSIVGLEGIATALGTASGFLALGVSYALSGMIADAVAGIYLLRDPDFNPGDEVTVGDMTGVVRAIELRKTRFETNDGTVVRGNADIEKRWTKRAPPQ